MSENIQSAQPATDRFLALMGGQVGDAAVAMTKEICAKAAQETTDRLINLLEKHKALVDTSIVKYGEEFDGRLVGAAGAMAAAADALRGAHAAARTALQPTATPTDVSAAITATDEAAQKLVQAKDVVFEDNKTLEGWRKEVDTSIAAHEGHERRLKLLETVAPRPTEVIPPIPTPALVSEPGTVFVKRKLDESATASKVPFYAVQSWSPLQWLFGAIGAIIGLVVGFSTSTAITHEAWFSLTWGVLFVLAGFFLGGFIGALINEHKLKKEGVDVL